MKPIALENQVVSKIYEIRQEKVMLDEDLALLYGVSTKVLNQAVKRNLERFPDDFMFRLNEEEFISLRSQFVTSNRGGRRYMPLAFTEQGIAMLSSVLKSEQAIQVNIQIIRTFTKLRKMALTHAQLLRKIRDLEKKYDKNFKIIFVALNNMLKEEDTRPLGFDVSQ